MMTAVKCSHVINVLLTVNTFPEILNGFKLFDAVIKALMKIIALVLH